MKKRFKKKGSVFITMLFCMIIILIVTAIFISHLSSVETSRMAQKAAQIVAEARAVAIDIPLKERYGYVEILHEPYTYDTKFPVPPLYNQVTQGYQNAILKPGDSEYDAMVKFADDSAKQAGISYLQGTTGDKGDGKKLLDMKPENICIEVVSLPEETVVEKDLECGPVNVPGEGTDKYIQTKDVPVYGSKHRLNGYTGQTGDIQNAIQNYNFVFVVVTYQEETFFYKAIQKFAHGDDESKWTAPPVRKVWALAYPQADFCTGGDC